ncbi:putative chitinase [Lentinula aciculospora]|uniref:Chitinase n=1 Tax=Lentinula aciculospora TaxID=153920 RepID=A0A9W9A5J3_9AGAR|nr:putative chitinase [Lentinula aciculospora]
MSFLLSSGAADMAMAWQTLSASQRSTIKQQYQAAGIKLLVSAFGSTETPTTSGMDATQVASQMAAWVKQYGVDGIDVDYEDSAAMNKADGKAEQWIIDFTNALRKELPQGQYTLTHAPMAPWMGSGTQWTSGAYVTVNTKVGSSIDWYNTQFYNQGASEYTTCDGLLTKSSSNNPKSSVFEIQANGFELNKIVIGKPGSTGTGDATNGQMSTSMLAGCVSQAKGKGWNAGVMSWEYPDANSLWITAVRGSAYPIDGSSGSGSSSSSTDSASPTSSATDSGSAPTFVPTDAGSSSTGDDSLPASAGASASSTTSIWTPGAAATPTSTTTFNDGMWTPSTTPATTVATPVPQRRNEQMSHRMVRRRVPTVL